MKFKADEIASVIQAEIETFHSQIDVREVGRVLEVGDGIARVYGLSGVMSGEMVEFPGGVIGLAFNLEESSVGVIILGDYLKIQEGDEVKSTGRLLSVPVGTAVIGRVVDPLGNPLDGKGPIVVDRAPRRGDHGPGRVAAQAGHRAAVDRHQGDRRHDADRPRPARVDHRRSQDRQNGDRHRHDHQSEKSGVKCFYVAVGQKESTTAGVIEALRQARCDGLHDRGRGQCQRSGPAAIRRPLRRHVDGRILHVSAASTP